MECPLRFISSSSTSSSPSFGDKNNSLWPKLVARDQCSPCCTTSTTHSKYSNQSYPSHFMGNNFFRTLRLSPDGYGLVTVDERQNVCFYNLPTDLVVDNQYYQTTTTESPSPSSTSSDGPIKLEPYSVINFGENIYDVVWAQSPLLASASDCKENKPEKEDTTLATAPYNAIFVSMKDHPIHLYALDDLSQPAAHYVGYDHLDEVESHHSLCYQMCGTSAKIYAGAEKKIRIFDVSRPGHDTISTITTTASNKCQMGQRGIISVLALQPNADSSSAVIAAGSFAGAASTVSLYSEKVGKYGSVMDITGFQQGVTALQWSSCGTYLWVGTRNSTFLSCYDTRNQKSLVCTIVKEDELADSIESVPIIANGNQRMGFSLDPWNRYLATGCYSSGKSKIFDVYSGQQVQSLGNKDDMRTNACVFHPFSALLFTISGHRVFEGNDQESSDSDSESDEEAKKHALKRKRTSKHEEISGKETNKTKVESCLSIWCLDREPIVYDNAAVNQIAANEVTTAMEEA